MTAKRREIKPRCLHCGKKRVRPDSFFCTDRCAAKWAYSRAGWDMTWCGKLHEDNPHGDQEGPHGWWDGKVDSDCPECADERDMAKEATDAK